MPIGIHEFVAYLKFNNLLEVLDSDAPSEIFNFYLYAVLSINLLIWYVMSLLKRNDSWFAQS